MMSAESKKKMKRLARWSMPFAMLQLASFLGVPFGLIYWLFNPIGWKIAVGALIALPFLSVIAKGFVTEMKKFEAEHEDDE